MLNRRSFAWLVVLVLGLASAGAPAVAERLVPPPSARGVLVASVTSFGSVGDADNLYVHRIEEGAVVELHHETLAARERVELAWADARTLWVMYGPRDDGSLELVTFVDGQRARSETRAAADWGELRGFAPHLHATVGGQIWLEMCAEGEPSPQKGVDSKCRKHSWRRLDAYAAAPATSKASQKVVKESKATKRTITSGLSVSYEGRTLEEMRQDPKPYDGLWTVKRGRKVIGTVPGAVLKVAPPAKQPKR